MGISDDTIEILCRSFTGAWIETLAYAKKEVNEIVAPSRERGLKPPALG